MLNCINKFVPYYYEFLPPFMINSLCGSYILGISVKSSGPLETFQHMVGYPTFGIIFGFLYPISYPLCAGYTLYKLNIKQQ
jgi:hypothetical protein